MAISRKKKSNTKIRRRSRRGWRQKFYRNNKQHIAWIIGGSSLLAAIIVIIIIFQITFFSSANTIKEISFSSDSTSTYHTHELYSTIYQELQDQNYYTLKWRKRDDISTRLSKLYPIIQDIELDRVSQQHIEVTIKFHDPTLRFQTPSHYVVSYENHLYTLSTGDTLGHNTLTLQLPRYTSGYYSLEGLLYTIDDTTLQDKVQTLLETLGSNNISQLIYLPGGEKLFLSYKGKQIYIHLDQDLNRQLIKLIDLENRYTGFDDIWTIDLGSIEDIIVK